MKFVKEPLHLVEHLGFRERKLKRALELQGKIFFTYFPGTLGLKNNDYEVL